MTVGNFVGGHVADVSLTRGLFVFFGLLLFGLAGLAFFAQTTVGLLIFVFIIGAASAAVSPAIQTRLMNVAGDSQTLAAAVNHASLNIGNSIGAALGGAAIGASLGYLSVTWVGVVLCVLGVIIAVVSFGTERRELHRAGGLGLKQDAVLDGPLS